MSKLSAYRGQLMIALINEKENDIEIQKCLLLTADLISVKQRLDSIRCCSCAHAATAEFRLVRRVTERPRNTSSAPSTSR